jgi:hypothetical protein
MEGVKVQLHSFLASALYGSAWATSHQGRFLLEERSPIIIDYNAGWADSWSGRFGEEKSLVSVLRLEHWIVQHVRQTLYRLSQPTSEEQAEQKQMRVA